MTDEQLRQEILIVCKANNVPVTGELWLGLVFMDKSQLVKLAMELHIAVK